VITKPELGGAQLSTLSLVSNLPKDKYAISVITSSRGILKADFEKLKNIRTYFSPFLIRPINPIVDILAFIHIYSIYRCNGFKIIHTHSSKAGLLGRWAAFFARAPVILHTAHGWPFNDYQPLLVKRFYIFLERIIALFTTKIICVSKKDIETGLKYKIAPLEKFILIRYGISLPEFKKSSSQKEHKKKELGINNNDPVVGMISCLKPQKAPLDYVKACIDIYDKMPGVNFLLVGDGVLRKRCKEELAKSGLNGRFIFTGWRRDVADILDIIDVVVLTSKWEGMPIAIIEALSKGKPVVVTDTGGVRELIKYGITGYVTKPGECKETAEMVLRVLKDRVLYNKMSYEARLSIDESFDIAVMVDKIDSLYMNMGSSRLRSNNMS
ncbi:MAG: glycosyltransferase family 4 protein, partial [Candidatus Omnitrophota bacterium]|nr:glycosyltransferase family 4 protein [Candidatus Omnitrophota bacterium]